MCQELKIPFQCISTSEVNEKYRSFAYVNHAESVTHWYATMKDQQEGKTCVAHTDGGGPCPVVADVQYMILGTPCNPFSVQRPKRFLDGSVREHSMYEQTFKDAFEHLRVFQPLTVTMEQTGGFDLPESKSVSTTPMQRRVGNKRKRKHVPGFLMASRA